MWPPACHAAGVTVGAGEWALASLTPVPHRLPAGRSRPCAAIDAARSSNTRPHGGRRTAGGSTRLRRCTPPPLARPVQGVSGVRAEGTAWCRPRRHAAAAGGGGAPPRPQWCSAKATRRVPPFLAGSPRLAGPRGRWQRPTCGHAGATKPPRTPVTSSPPLVQQGGGRAANAHQRVGSTQPARPIQPFTIGSTSRSKQRGGSGVVLPGVLPLGSCCGGRPTPTGGFDGRSTPPRAQRTLGRRAPQARQRPQQPLATAPPPPSPPPPVSLLRPGAQRRPPPWPLAVPVVSRPVGSPAAGAPTGAAAAAPPAGGGAAPPNAPAAGGHPARDGGTAHRRRSAAARLSEGRVAAGGGGAAAAGARL